MVESIEIPVHALKVAESSAMHHVLAFLIDPHVIQLQVVCRRWYTKLVPLHLSRGVNVGQGPKFLIADVNENKNELHEFCVDAKEPQWKTYGLPADFVLQSGSRIVSMSPRGGRYFMCGGVLQENTIMNTNQSPCFEFLVDRTFKRKSMMTECRLYMCLTAVQPRVTLGDSELGFKNSFVYALGGKTHFGVNLKTIEKYDVERDEWIQVKCQLNSERLFASSCVFESRYIYVFGGGKDNCIELVDTEELHVKTKCSRIMLNLPSGYTPWFKEIMLPLQNNEVQLIFGGNSENEALSDEQQQDYQSDDQEEHEVDTQDQQEQEEGDEGEVISNNEESAEEASDDCGGSRFILLISSKQITQYKTTQYMMEVPDSPQSNFQGYLEPLGLQQSLPIKCDTFYHQNFLESGGSKFILGGNYIDRIKLDDYFSWEHIGKGSDEFQW